MREARAVDPLQEILGVAERRPPPLVEHQRKLVAAEPECANAVLDDKELRELLEHRVAGRVPMSVVDLFEVVDVDKAERERRSFVGRAFESGGELELVRAVVAEVGEAIGMRVSGRDL